MVNFLFESETHQNKGILNFYLGLYAWLFIKNILFYISLTLLLLCSCVDILTEFASLGIPTHSI